MIRNRNSKKNQTGGGVIRTTWKFPQQIKDKKILLKQVIDSVLTTSKYAGRKYSPQLIVYLDSLTDNLKNTDTLLTLDEARELLRELEIPFIEDPEINVEIPAQETPEETIRKAYEKTRKSAQFFKEYSQFDIENRRCQENLARLTADLKRVGLERDTLQNEIQAQQQQIKTNEEELARIRKLTDSGNSQQVERLEAEIKSKEVESANLLENIATKEQLLQEKEREISRLKEQAVTETQSERS